MIRATALAVLTRIRTDTALTVYDNWVPDLPAMPYVVLWTAASTLTAERLSGEQTNGRVWFQTTAVGLTPDQARAVQERTRTTLLDAQVAVPGRATERVKLDASPALARDDSTDPPVFTAIDQWHLFSVPAL